MKPTLVASAFRRKSDFRRKSAHAFFRLKPEATRYLLSSVLCILVSVAAASASDRYALIVSGANGEATYAEQYGQWRQAASLALMEKLGFEGGHILRSTTAATRSTSRPLPA